MAAATLKEHRFELVEVGEEFGPRPVLVDSARLKAFAFAQDDFGEWQFGPSPFGGPVSHPSLLANELMQVYFERYRIDVHEGGGGDGGAWLEEAHVEETLWFEAPLAVGETVQVSGRFADKYVVGGRGAVVLEGDARTADGRIVLRHRGIEYFRMDGPAPDDGRREPPLRRVERDPGAGQTIPALEKTITRPQLLVFSSLDHPGAQQSIHTDTEIAARAGLPAPLVQGQQLACHMAEAMADYFGAPWYSGGMIRTRFLGAVCAGETVRVGGIVRDDWSNGELQAVDVWVENEVGEMVAVGNATGPVPS